MGDTPKVGELIEHDLTPANTSLVDAGETVCLLVTDSDDETGVYGGYAFLPGGAGMPYVRVDPDAPEPAPVGITSETPTLSDLVEKVKGDKEFVEFLAWKDAQAAAQTEPPEDSAPMPEPNEPPAPEPTPDNTPGNPPFSSGDQPPAQTETGQE
jgi:hypothetical protein